ncbi:hypothetical protein ZIOFF_024800 [Zingiber officinale]|uniref:Cysteine proteinase inhibitor n=1 Tax=Zingiber officinale TaxID=94328 RepID=A0A8J5LDS6_ZINOF|nr:hypothetical protein ZIOFF_024800 [Zingiber officinale]
MHFLLQTLTGLVSYRHYVDFFERTAALGLGLLDGEVFFSGKHPSSSIPQRTSTCGRCSESSGIQQGTAGRFFFFSGEFLLLQSLSSDVDSCGRHSEGRNFSDSNALLEFARVVKAREQVVARTLHHLTVEAVEGGEKKLYEAKV